MTTIYFIRHSKPMKVKSLNNNDHVQIQNEKTILSVEGEERAKILSKLADFNSIDCVIASNYVRTVATAKYVANKNNLDILIDEDFGERKQGINSWAELPNDFEIKQFNDETYKIGNGENQIEVQERMYNALLKVLNEYKDKKVTIFSHGTAMIYLFLKWCKADFDGSTFKLIFNNKIIFENDFNAPEIFKLIFDNIELISIENIKPDELR